MEDHLLISFHQYPFFAYHLLFLTHTHYHTYLYKIFLITLHIFSLFFSSFHLHTNFSTFIYTYSYHLSLICKPNINSPTYIFSSFTFSSPFTSLSLFLHTYPFYLPHITHFSVMIN